MSCGEAKAQRHKGDVPLHRFPENIFVISAYVAHLKPTPQVEALRQVNQPFSQASGKVFQSAIYAVPMVW